MQTNFEKQYEQIEAQRKARNAPIDSMGTGALDYSTDPKIRRFQILVSEILASKTKLDRSSQALKRLQKRGLSLEMIDEIDKQELAELISEVKFWQPKVGYLKKIVRRMKERYEGDVPKTVEEICDLPKVGMKMAIIALTYGWGECVGIAVDSHFHRVANRIGWVETKKEEQTRIALEGFVPREKWKEISGLITGFGQQVCKEKIPNCLSCNLKENCSFNQAQQEN